MSSFDKFINDLEKRQERKKIIQAKLQQHKGASVRDRVLRYAELWQNSVRYSPEVKK